MAHKQAVCCSEAAHLLCYATAGYMQPCISTTTVRKSQSSTSCAAYRIPEKRATQACLLERELQVCLHLSPCMQSLANAAPLSQNLPELRSLQPLSSYLQSQHAACKTFQLQIKRIHC